MDWQTRYARFPRAFGTEPTAFVREVFEAPVAHGLGEGPARILCPGDGYGRNGLWLAGRGHHVLALELVDSAVADAMAQARERDLNYRSHVADLTVTPFPLGASERVDIVVSAWVRLEQEAQRRDCNRECLRHLRPGGHVVIVAGGAVTAPEQEREEWGPGMRWRDLSTADEVRLVGQLGTGADSAHLR